MLETPARIEPCLFEDDVPRVLADLAVEIQRESATVGNGLNQDSLVPHHSDDDWLILSQFRMGRSFGATRTWMLRATPVDAE